MTSRRVRSEDGAIAIVFAICAVIIFGVAAMGVDLGNAMDRQRQSQTDADLAALAGAYGLPSTGSSTVQLVADYLNKNQASSDGSRCNASTGPVTVTQLTDGNYANGEVTFPKSGQIAVTVPQSLVAFGVANAIGYSDHCVGATATAKIASSAIGLAPFYTAGSCSTGSQTLKSGPAGTPPASAPTLSHNAEKNAASLSAISPASMSKANVGDPDGPLVALTGTKLDSTNVDLVGFFNADLSEPKTAAVVTQSATSLSALVPNSVGSVTGTWWVRVRSAKNGKWSDTANAQAFTVGDTSLNCGSGASSGNFGAIDLPWGGNDAADLTKNLQVGLRPPTSLTPWTGTLPADNTCNTDPAGVISTDALSKADTNCVQSVTGLKAPPAYDGYLSPGTGRLMVPTSPRCQSQGRPSSGSYGENADLLTCFLKNSVLTLADTIAYNGTDALFDQSIYKSPRLIVVPVLAHDPNGNKWMPVVKFAAGFITDQPATASQPLPMATTSNGLVVSGGKLTQITVFFFSVDALPPPPDGGQLMDYFGSGKKVVTLVN